jgi:hypothetical protein
LNIRAQPGLSPDRPDIRRKPRLLASPTQPRDQPAGLNAVKKQRPPSAAQHPPLKPGVCRLAFYPFARLRSCGWHNFIGLLAVFSSNGHLLSSLSSLKDKTARKVTRMLAHC